MNNTIAIVGAGSNAAVPLIPMLVDELGASVTLITSSNLEFDSPNVQVYTVDVTDRLQLKNAILANLPSTIINLAAYTDVDGCEINKTLAWKVNTTLAENLVRVARVADAHLVQLSTDYVFDGERGPYTENDVPQPINYYGKTKLAAENVVSSSGIDATILRTNVLYGPRPNRPDFVLRILQNFEKGLPTRAANNLFSNPTYIDDLAEAILHIIQNRKTGLYHVSGADYVSRYDFACAIAETFKLDVAQIESVDAGELQFAAKRPQHAGLVSLKAQTAFYQTYRGIHSGLVSYRHSLFTST